MLRSQREAFQDYQVTFSFWESNPKSLGTWFGNANLVQIKKLKLIGNALQFEKSKWKLLWKTFQSLRFQFKRVKVEMKSLTQDWKAFDKNYKIYTCKFDLCLFQELLAFKIVKNQCVPILRKDFRNEFCCQFCNWNVAPMDTCRIYYSENGEFMWIHSKFISFIFSQNCTNLM